MSLETHPVTLTDRNDERRNFTTEIFRRRSDVDPLIDQLRDAGILALADVLGSCAHDEEGHYHPLQLKIVGITEEQARKLLPKGGQS